jgi:predicted nucleic acid-binding Zn ribbon protein
MPTYVYRFLDSEDTIEVQQSFDDEPLTEAVHPSDGQVHPVKKVFTPVGITFKGGGFYKTDSRGKSSASSGSPSSSTGSSDSSGSSGESSSSTKTDSPPSSPSSTSSTSASATKAD